MNKPYQYIPAPAGFFIVKLSGNLSCKEPVVAFAVTPNGAVRPVTFVDGVVEHISAPLLCPDGSVRSALGVWTSANDWYPDALKEKEALAVAADVAANAVAAAAAAAAISKATSPYSDYPFNSPLESDWARLFDALGFAWDYTQPSVSSHRLFFVTLGSASSAKPRDGCWFWVKSGLVYSEDRDAFQSVVNSSNCPGYLATGFGVNHLTRFEVVV